MGSSGHASLRGIKFSVRQIQEKKTHLRPGKLKRMFVGTIGDCQEVVRRFEEVSSPLLTTLILVMAI